MKRKDGAAARAGWVPRWSLETDTAAYTQAVRHWIYSAKQNKTSVDTLEDGKKHSAVSKDVKRFITNSVTVDKTSWKQCKSGVYKIQNQTPVCSVEPLAWPLLSLLSPFTSISEEFLPRALKVGKRNFRPPLHLFVWEELGWSGGMQRPTQTKTQMLHKYALPIPTMNLNFK